MNLALRSWTSEERRRRSSAQRLSTSIHKQRAVEEATFGGLLTDLVERHDLVSCVLSGGRNVTGQLDSLGSDHVGMIVPGGRTLVALAAIRSLSIEATARSTAAGNRPLPEDAEALSDVLSERAIDLPQIRVCLIDSDKVISGLLDSAGRDLVTILVGRPASRTEFVRIDAIGQLTFV
jgi:hypothetical protein